MVVRPARLYPCEHVDALKNLPVIIHPDRIDSTSGAPSLKIDCRREMAVARAPPSAASFMSTAPRKPIPTIATLRPLRMLRRKILNAQPSGSAGKDLPASEAGSLSVAAGLGAAPQLVSGQADQETRFI